MARTTASSVANNGDHLVFDVLDSLSERREQELLSGDAQHEQNGDADLRPPDPPGAYRDHREGQPQRHQQEQAEWCEERGQTGARYSLDVGGRPESAAKLPM